MKKKNKIYLLTVISILVSLFFVKNYFFNKLSSLEKEKTALLREYDDKKKLLDKKIYDHNNSFDLYMIKKKMEKKGMKLADKIIFFEVEE